MTDIYQDGSRQFRICNACRYCEGYCAVWDAIERHESILKSDLKYLSHLCHDCRECYYVCPYTDPHEFNLNIPKVLSEIRSDTYGENIHPIFLRWFYLHPKSSWTIVSVFATIFAFLISIMVDGPIVLTKPVNEFQDIFPEIYFKWFSSLLYLYALILWAVDGYSFWHSFKRPEIKVRISHILGGLYDALSHRYFAGGGAGCSYPDENGSYLRLAMHPLVLMGFIVDLIAILFYPKMNFYVTTIYVAGAFMMLGGSLGLLIIKSFSDPKLAGNLMISSDIPFTSVMLLTGLTGVLFPILPGTLLMSYLFLIHVGLVAAIFIMAPFSKFLHPVFRILSLIMNRAESSESVSPD